MFSWFKLENTRTSVHTFQAHILFVLLILFLDIFSNFINQTNFF